jgi:putative addiction module component (TIGR02574 family)
VVRPCATGPGRLTLSWSQPVSRRHAAKSVALPPPGFDDLSVDEKIDYLQSLWDRIAATPETIPVPDWHRDVIDERLKDLEDNPGAGDSWEVVRDDSEKNSTAATDGDGPHVERSATSPRRIRGHSSSPQWPMMSVVPCCTLSHTPFTLGPQTRFVVVLAVLHLRRNPAVWRRRVQ